MIDGTDIALQGGGSAVSVALGYGLSKLLGFRQREREEDAAERRREEFDAMRDRVTKLEGRADAHSEQLDELLAELRELRRDVRNALELRRSSDPR